MSDISKLLYALVIILQVKFETILKCHEWYMYMYARDHAQIMLLFVYTTTALLL